jgi:hypothetical protein
MILSIEQATAAGKLAAAITAIQGAIDDLRAAIEARAVSSEFQATVTIGGSGRTMRAAIPMNEQATAGVFSQVIAAYEAQIAVLNEQLAALTA